MGFFAALYARVTSAMAAHIERGFFDDGPRMERLDVKFARLYIEAAERRVAGTGGVGRAWTVAFDACEEREPMVLQHLYVGMNAHLLVDLPIAVAEVGSRSTLASLRRDFRRINEVVEAEMGSFHEDSSRDLAAPRPLLQVERPALVGGEQRDALRGARAGLASRRVPRAGGRPRAGAPGRGARSRGGAAGEGGDPPPMGRRRAPRCPRGGERRRAARGSRADGGGRPPHGRECPEMRTEQMIECRGLRTGPRVARAETHALYSRLFGPRGPRWMRSRC